MLSLLNQHVSDVIAVENNNGIKLNVPFILIFHFKRREMIREFRCIFKQWGVKLKNENLNKFKAIKNLN